MFPFWDIALAPLLDALKPRRMVEIGSLRGETTTLVLDRLEPSAELHVIDPLPEFDPAEHEQRFGGRYVFHRDLSLNVLPTLPPVDLAFVDGDHNWYTVYNELTLLAATAAEAGQPLPVLVLHDVGWPYGRRDLYYDPEQIPPEFRQPFAQQGIQWSRSKLVERGGLNPQLHNAIEEGGPRNGVATALDDFLADHDGAVRRVELLVYFGLAIVAPEERLADNADLRALLDRLEGLDTHKQLLALSERLYAGAMIAHHSVLFPQREALAEAGDSYLDLLATTLLDEPYIENELRAHHLMLCTRDGVAPDLRILRDPVAHMPDEAKRLRAQRATGRIAGDGNDTRAYFPYTTMGRHRLDHLRRCLDTIRAEAVSGDLLELGTGRGGGGIFMRGWLRAHGIGDKRVWVADDFRVNDDDTSRSFHPAKADLNAVREGFARLGLLDDHVLFLQGSPPEMPMGKLALIRVGDGLTATDPDLLALAYSKLVTGGFVIVEDYFTTPGRQDAVDRFRATAGLDGPLERVDAAGVVWRKLEAGAATPSPADTPQRDLDLSVVVVVHNMRREAQRTLHSLSRAYQESIDDLAYEVIVVENGSDPDQALGEELVRSFGPEFRYLVAEPTTSPVPALNAGIAIARGAALALMIDGAHLLTPGVLRHGIEGLNTYAPAVVATQQWYIGPGEQPDAVLQGYDRSYEDRLLEQIGWPARGYDLFAISHFIGDRDWLDNMGESNCLFVPRELVEQSGAFDAEFAEAGGGFANLDIYERLGSTPGTTLVTILGEGSFHQVHGGTTTNTADAVERRRRIWAYRSHYEEMRGKSYRPPAKEMHYVGHMPRNTARTRARRRVLPNLFKAAGMPDPDGLPSSPALMPDDLKLEYTDSYWKSLGWQQTAWLGEPVRRSAADLVAFQEAIQRVRPDLILNVHAQGTSLAPFLASLCDLLGQGEVIAIGPDSAQHPRIEQVAGDPLDASVLAAVQERVAKVERTLVVLGSQAKFQRTLDEFAAYSPFVPVGSYVVIESTIIGGRPVWPSFGTGPGEAVAAILGGSSQDFTPDLTLETLGVTFNPRGWLRRVSA